MSFTRRANPVWLFDDLVGNILDDNYYMSFLENTIPYLPKDVYHDDQGTTPWANPLQFSPDGTLPVDLYFEDGGVYRLEIRRGPAQTDPLIRLIENFTDESGNDPGDANLPIDNQITNPQFAFISFNESLVITNTGNNSYDIAPGWILDLESGGSAVLTITRTPIAGDDNIPTENPTNPSYVLSFEVTSGTFTAVNLRQRFDHAPAIWASQGISINFTGKMLANSAEITVQYAPSDGSPQTVIDDSLSSVYQLINGGIQLDPSTSTHTGANGYVDIIFNLPISGTTFITNIQAIGSLQAASYPYAQTTVERQKDHLFHYYADSILQQPKASLLTGWNFALNPWQFRASTANNVVDNTYTADQTIIIQQKFVESNTGNHISVARGTAAENYAFVVSAVSATNEFAIIQYIDASTIRPYWGKNLSSMVNALISSPTHNTTCRFKMRLIYRSTAPVPAITRTEPIATWVTGSEPTLAAGWLSLSPLNDPEYTFGDGSEPFNFDLFELVASSTDDMMLGIMIYTLDNLDQTATADRILFDRISLVQNDFAIDVPPETYDESMRKCEFYYEKSYAKGVLPGTVTHVGQRYSVAPLHEVVNDILYRKTFNLVYNSVKRAIVTPTFYSPASATPGFVQMGLYLPGTGFVGAASPVNEAIAGWTPIGPLPGIVNSASEQAVTMFAASAAQVDTAVGLNGAREGVIFYHYTVDARLGI